MPRTISEIAGREVSNMTLPDLAKAIVSRSGLPVPDTNDRDLCRAAFSSVSGAADLAALVNTSILRGFAAGPDTTAGWVRTVPLPNFLAAQIAVPSTGVRLGPVPRGSTAPSVSFSIDATGWRLARFGAQFAITEEDYENGKQISVMELAIEQIGAAARRIIPDLVYSLILTNGNLSDGTPLFDATRSNLGTAALADTALDAGLAAIGSQVSTDEAGDPIHLGLSARYLVVPPGLEGAARRLCRNMAMGQGDLIVQPESRLGTAGVVDPRTDEIVEGSATNWLLAGPSEQAAGIVVGLLNGRAEPTIREFRLGQGEFGLGYDIQFSVGVAAVSGQPLYFSTGTV